MSREWQQTRFKEFVMPDAVYYQSIWAVRDLQRMENRLHEIEHDTTRVYNGSMVFRCEKGFFPYKTDRKKCAGENSA